MSWEEYVSNMVCQGAENCGIYMKTGAPCAQSAGFNVSPEEVKKLVNYMNPSYAGEKQMEVGGVPCIMTRCDEECISGKTKKPHKTGTEDKMLYHVESTNSFIVIVGKTGAGERQACKICAGISSYLKGSGN